MVQTWHRRALLEILVLLSALWNLLFSPFSGAHRVAIALACGLILLRQAEAEAAKTDGGSGRMKTFETLRRRAGRLSGRSRAVGLFFCDLGGRPRARHRLPVNPSADRDARAGAEAFGLWMTLTGIGAVIAFADFGVGQGAQNKLAEAFASHRLELARRLWDSTVIFFAGVGLLLAVIAAWCVRTIDFTALFNLADPLMQREASRAVAVTLGLFCLNFPCGLAQRLANSRQQGWRHKRRARDRERRRVGRRAARDATGLASSRASFAVAQAPLVLANGGLLLWQLTKLRWTDRPRLRGDWTAMRELLRTRRVFRRASRCNWCCSSRCRS